MNFSGNPLPTLYTHTPPLPLRSETLFSFASPLSLPRYSCVYLFLQTLPSPRALQRLSPLSWQSTDAPSLTRTHARASAHARMLTGTPRQKKPPGGENKADTVNRTCGKRWWGEGVSWGWWREHCLKGCRGACLGSADKERRPHPLCKTSV